MLQSNRLRTSALAFGRPGMQAQQHRLVLNVYGRQRFVIRRPYSWRDYNPITYVAGKWNQLTGYWTGAENKVTAQPTSSDKAQAGDG